MPSNHLILCRPLLLLPSIFPSIGVFSKESVLCIRWPQYWSFSFSISPSNEYSGLISFRMDWLDLLAVQETLKILLQHHNTKPSILWWSAFFIVQLSHPYMTTEKTIALTRWTFVGKIMPLLFNMLPRLIITFLPRSKRLLISWLQSPFAVILEPPQNKVCHCLYCLPIYLLWSDGTRNGSDTQLLHGAGAAGNGEEIPHVQGQERRLCFAGLTIRRYPKSKVRETPVRQYVLERLWGDTLHPRAKEKPKQDGLVEFSSVAQWCPTLWDPMYSSTPGLPVHHQLPEFTQTHVHRVGDAVQPSHPLSSPSPAPNPSQHQGLF